MSDQAVLLPKWFTPRGVILKSTTNFYGTDVRYTARSIEIVPSHGRIILAKEQLGHSYTY